jgi:hypothetical protein
MSYQFQSDLHTANGVDDNKFNYKIDKQQNDCRFIGKIKDMSFIENELKETPTKTDVLKMNKAIDNFFKKETNALMRESPKYIQDDTDTRAFQYQVLSLNSVNDILKKYNIVANTQYLFDIDIDNRVPLCLFPFNNSSYDTIIEIKLNDWSWGQIDFVGNTNISHWHAGEILYWHNTCPILKQNYGRTHNRSIIIEVNYNDTLQSFSGMQHDQIHTLKNYIGNQHKPLEDGVLLSAFNNLSQHFKETLKQKNNELKKKKLVKIFKLFSTALEKYEQVEIKNNGNREQLKRFFTVLDTYYKLL